MFLKIEKLPVNLPVSSELDPQTASQLQRLLGGRFGEMATLMNYAHQAFNFRHREVDRNYYALIANIATEENAHVEIVTAMIDSLLNGPRIGGNTKPVYAPGADVTRASWAGEYVFSNGNLALELLHNFFLENGACTQKLQAYEATSNPAVRELIAYLYVRDTAHALAYARAIEALSGVEMSKLLPVVRPDMSALPEIRKFHEQKLHLKLYQFAPQDIEEIGPFWSGEAPQGYADIGGELGFIEAPPADTDLSHLVGVAYGVASEQAPGDIFDTLYSRL